MKKLIFIAVLLIETVTANAQNKVGQLSVAPTIGINYSKANIRDPRQKYVPGLWAGVNAEYGLTEEFGASVGLFYSRLGSKHDEAGSGQIKLTYIAMPILINYYLWKGLAIKAGVEPAYLTKATDEAEGGEDAISIKKDCKLFDLAIPVGVSYEIANIVVDMRYIHGTQRVNKVGQPIKMKHRFQVSAAYKFKF
ncbi:MAG: PorT family protein [Prevotella sp.]|nr:PorT family protein [Prevotella sp.]